MDEPPVLELRGITKQFPGVLANDHIDFDLRRGEVHALLGENGAGKSTLMSILYGLYTADSGQILHERQARAIHSPKHAIELGIGMVHQHFMLIPVMTVTENIVLANEPVHAGVSCSTSRRGREARCATLAKTFNFAVDPHARIQDITGRAAAARRDPEGALPQCRHPHPRRADRRARRRRRRGAVRDPRGRSTPRGNSIIFITHKLNEVLEIADRITRAAARQEGRHDSARRRNGGRARTARWSDARSCFASTRAGQPGELLLKVEDLSVHDDRGLEAVRGVTFDVRAGEIVGIAGVDGNGQSELIDALTGLRELAGGPDHASAAKT